MPGGKEGFDLRDVHLSGVAFVVEEDIAFDPVYVGLFGADGAMFAADGVADLVQQLSFGAFVHSLSSL